MAELFETKYPTNIRTVNPVVPATAIVYQDDVVLECDTSAAPVNLTLLGIPFGSWSTQYKVYVRDISNNASVNNITINAGNGVNPTTGLPVAQTINGGPSVTINTNGGAVLVRIVDNYTYIAQYNGNPTVIDDTGWVDLEGFGYYGVGVQKPQCRRIGKVIYFRGNVVVPLDNPAVPGTVVPLTSFTAYNGVFSPTPFTGAPNGVTANPNGSIAFNNNGVVIPTSVVPALTNFDSAYSSGVIIGTRPIQLSLGSTNGTSLSTVVSVIIQQDKRLVFQLLKDIEIPSGLSGVVGNSALRFITSNVRSGEFLPDYLAAATDIQNAPANANFPLVSDTFNQTYPFSCDAGDETQIGGFIVRIDGLLAYLT